MIMPDVPSDLFTKFNDITYYDEPHKYYYKGKQFTSVTTLIHKFEEGFDEEYWSEIKGNEYGLSAQTIKFLWKFINEKATTKGSVIHDYAENRFLNKVFPYPKDMIENKFRYDAVIREYEKTKKYVDEFFEKTKGKLIPIKTELIVYDTEHGIAGMVDLLVWNVKAQEFQIWDYKTNKDFTFESDRRLSGVLSTLMDCDLEKYSLQLSTYKFIIEKNTNVKIGKCYLVWFSHRNSSYKIIEAKNREYYVKQMFEFHT